jgi:hypothetical protein
MVICYTTGIIRHFRNSLSHKGQIVSIKQNYSFKASLAIIFTLKPITNTTPDSQYHWLAKKGI